MEAWFLSDIHLTNSEGRNGKTLLRFLHFLGTQDPQKTQLYFLGDIFDLWIGGSNFFAKKYGPIVAAIKDLHSKGFQITMIEGNHDVHIDEYFNKKLKIPVFVEAQYVEINGLKIRIEHGDLINLNDEKYLKYRALIRTRWVKLAKSFLPGRFWNYAGTRASHKSRQNSGNYRAQNEGELVTMIREHAHRIAGDSPAFDVIISGHMHVIDDYQFAVSGKKIRSFNLGSWFEPEIKILHLKNQEWIFEDARRFT